ncbi:MAG: sugar ABC transporter substrate-binding protein [Eubacteriales bacterium]|nr:sugar ABC transporter substrate-binding protein [Eubacteriales bacterium]
MKKKLISVLLGLSMVFTTGIPVFAAEEENTGLSGEIHVASWNASADGLEEIAEKFMELNPGTTVVVDKVDAEYTKLYPALASGVNVPDVIQIQQTDFQAFLNNYEGSFADVSDIVEPEKDNFAANALGVTIGQDGKYYAVPWDIGPCAMMYRKDIFEEAGVDAESITTWEEYLEAGKVILEKTGVKMFGFCYNGSSSSDAVKLFLHQQGGVYYDEEGKVDLTTDKMLKGISFLKEMQDAGITMDLPSEWDDRITALNADQIASLPYPVWYTGTLMSSVAEQSGKWGIAPMPCFEGEESGEVSMGGCVLAISANSENLELAKAYTAYAMMDDEANEINFKWGQFPSYKPSYETDAFKQVDEYFGVSRGEIFTKLVNSPVIDFGPYFTDVDQSMRTAIGEIFVNDADPETALASAEEAAQRIIDAK